MLVDAVPLTRAGFDRRFARIRAGGSDEWRERLQQRGAAWRDDPGSVTAPVRLRPSSVGKMTAGMSVEVEILGPEHTAAVIVPTAAIVRDGETTVVMTVGADSKAHRNEVEEGVTSSEATEILKGIKAGDRVIVRGQNRLPDGPAVTIGS